MENLLAARKVPERLTALATRAVSHLLGRGGNGNAPEIEDEISAPAKNLDEAPPTSVQSEFDL